MYVIDNTTHFLPFFQRIYKRCLCYIVIVIVCMCVYACGRGDGLCTQRLKNLLSILLCQAPPHPFEAVSLNLEFEFLASLESTSDPPLSIHHSTEVTGTRETMPSLFQGCWHLNLGPHG